MGESCVRDDGSARELSFLATPRLGKYAVHRPRPATVVAVTS